MRTLVTGLAYVSAMAALAMVMVGFIAGDEIQRMYQHNGHSLNPMVYATAGISNCSAAKRLQAAGARFKQNHPYLFGTHDS